MNPSREKQFHSKICDGFHLTAATFNPFLAHLSRRLIGELIVWAGIRRPSVIVHHPSTFSNNISSEAMKPILTEFHI